jgi:diaminopimelate decarboxylase
MNIICTVADIKDNIIILNGSLNLVNIGSRTYDYTPIINLSNPSNSEINYRIYGSLCTQQLDLWGFYAYAKKFKIGDIVMITNQGAYTYSLAQRFGADIAPVYSMK